MTDSRKCGIISCSIFTAITIAICVVGSMFSVSHPEQTKFANEYRLMIAQEKVCFDFCNCGNDAQIIFQWKAPESTNEYQIIRQCRFILCIIENANATVASRGQGDPDLDVFLNKLSNNDTTYRPCREFIEIIYNVNSLARSDFEARGIFTLWQTMAFFGGIVAGMGILTLCYCWIEPHTRHTN